MTDYRRERRSARRAASGRAPRVQGTVRVVGAGLLGASIGHALTALGVDVALDDTSPGAAAPRRRLRGRSPRATTTTTPTLVVVACRRTSRRDVIERELARFPRAVVTDVASVKLEPLRTLRERGVDLTHYIGSHPLAGRERGGAISARADIFLGRPWVVAATRRRPPATSPSSRASRSTSARPRSR